MEIVTPACAPAVPREHQTFPQVEVYLLRSILVKFPAVLARIQPFLSRSVEKNRATNPDSNL
jgi:hypothetical protein